MENGAGDQGPGDLRSLGGWRIWVPVLGASVILPYAAVAALPTPYGRKVAFSATLVLGREAFRRYRRYSNPRTWFARSGKG